MINIISQTISDVVVHKHPDSPQVMGFENKKKSIEHTYATLEGNILFHAPFSDNNHPSQNLLPFLCREI